MFINYYLNSLLIFKWLDFFEISFFSILIYFCSIWLSSDKTKNLLIIFYSMLSIFIIANYYNMSAIHNFLLGYWPTFFVIFFLFHQKTLQRNFISAKKISNPNNLNIDWIDELVRSCVNAMVNNKQIICIIEGRNLLNEFLNVPFSIDSIINKEFLNLIIHSQYYDQNKMLIINNEGKLHSINASWNIEDNDLFIIHKTQNLNDWQKNSIILTSNLDALIFKTYPTKRTFDIILQGRLIEDLSSNNVLSILEQFIKKIKLNDLKKSWVTNENGYKKNWFNESNI